MRSRDMDLLVLVIAAAAFGGVWWGLSKLGAHSFFVASLSFLAGLIVFVSRSLLGVPL
jgi:hypothetical protein